MKSTRLYPAIFTILIALPLCGFADDKIIRPGEMRFLKFPAATEKATLTCKETPVPLWKNGETLVAVISESYFSKLEPFKCVLKTGTKTVLTMNYKVEAKEYPHETLHVDPTRITVSSEDQKRVDAERELVKKVYANSLESLQIKEPFIAPLKSKITSPYGIKRTYNAKKEGEHLGVDFRAGVGVKIPASNRGRVVLSQELFMSGNLVIIDHGLGIFTQYHHMSKRFVNTGDTVEKGQIIGLAGKTGRVSGPHLHWGINIQGNAIDGFNLVDESKAYFAP